MGIKDKITHNFVGAYLVSWLHIFECKILPKLVPDEKAVKKYHLKKFGKELDLDNPQTFAEKTNWYKLKDRKPIMKKCADKCDVREYVIGKGLGDTLNEIYGVYYKVSDINFDKLPEKYVLKAAHGSHMNVIVDGKKKISWKDKAMMRTWLRQDIYWSGREWVYKDIPRRIIAEKYIEDSHGELRDYKFFCYHGEPVYWEYDSDRFSGNPHRNFLDMNLNDLGVNDGVPNAKLEKDFISQDVFEEMKRMAKILAEDFQFVRVDFYEIYGKVMFGEMTFYDGGGSTYYEPDEWNIKLAEKWIINQ